LCFGSKTGSTKRIVERNKTGPTIEKLFHVAGINFLVAGAICFFFVKEKFHQPK